MEYELDQFACFELKRIQKKYQEYNLDSGLYKLIISVLILYCFMYYLSLMCLTPMYVAYKIPVRFL